MSEITIFLLYLLAAATFGGSRLPRFTHLPSSLVVAAWLVTAVAILLHGRVLYSEILTAAGFHLSITNTLSMIGLELALISLLAALEPTLRGIAAGLLVLGAAAAASTGLDGSEIVATNFAWQIQAHILVSLLSYGLLTVGAIVAVFAMLQERRLQAGRLSAPNNLFAPLETTESLLFGVAATGFAGLLLAILSGLTFVDNLFAQHLAHKTVFSLLALAVFGTLLAGRFFAGWRGKRAITLYLWGFLLLCFAYFGTRLILEHLNRSWG